MCGGYTHRPVLLEECVQGVGHSAGRDLCGRNPWAGGGHSEEIAKRLTAGGRLLCIDRDRQALEEGAARLAPWAGQITFLHGNFGDLDALLDQAGVGQVDGMLFDLGVSSPQLDDPERGFSYQTDAPLDMRMDREDTLTAWTVVNQWPQGGTAAHPHPVWGGTPRRRHCQCHRPSPGTGPHRHHRPTGGGHPAGHARRRPAGKAAPGQAKLPGHPHRGQR